MSQRSRGRKGAGTGEIREPLGNRRERGAVDSMVVEEVEATFILASKAPGLTHFIDFKLS